MRSLVLASCVVISLCASNIAFAQTPSFLPIDSLDTPDVDLQSYSSNLGAGFSGISDAFSEGLGGGGDHFDNAFGVSVNGTPYNATTGSPGTNELALEQLSFGQFDVSVGLRSVGPVVRQIVTVTNSGAAAGDVAIQWHNNTGNDGGQQTVATSDGNLSADVLDRWIVTADDTSLLTGDNEVNTWVLFGIEGSGPSSVDLVDGAPGFGFAGDEGLTAVFDLQLEAGETESLLWFVGIEGFVQDGIDLANQLGDQSSDLFQDLVVDLTLTEQSQISNFAVPEPGSTTLLGSLGMLLLMSRRKQACSPV